MKEDMSNMMQTLSTMLNGKNSPNELKQMIQNYQQQNTNNQNNTYQNQNKTTQRQDIEEDFPNFEDFTSSFSNSSHTTDDSNTTSSNPFSNIDMNMIFKMKQIMDKVNQKKEDPRSNLLLSLKPYLKPSRKQKVDQYIQFFNMSSIMENFNSMGGEKKK